MKEQKILVKSQGNLIGTGSLKYIYSADLCYSFGKPVIVVI
jgi:hypothetical protein